MSAALRPLTAVPRLLWLVLSLCLLLQVLWRLGERNTAPQAHALPAPPSVAAARLASLGEPLAMARGLLLHLQSFEDQPGVSLAWRALDYERLAGWLETAQALDPRSQYALAAASGVYAGVADPARVRRMLRFVADSYAADPQRRWPAMAQATLTARHQLHDLPLARSYARQLRLHATGPGVPAWVRQMEAFILEDMDELESAQLVLGALMASGQITDANELAFMARRLDQMATRKREHAGNAGH